MSVLLTRTVPCKLLVSPDQEAALVALQPRITAAYNQAAAYAFAHPEIKGAVQLHHALYTTLRATHGLKSQFVCNVQRDAMGSVASLRKRVARGKKVSAPVSFARAIPYDARTMKVRDDRGAVELATDARRIECALVSHQHLRRYADWSCDSARLRKVGPDWILTLSLTKEVVEPKPTPSVLGCDRGIVIPAALSNGKLLGDPAWHQVDRRYFRTRNSLQAKGTTSAKRRLRKRSDQWQRFRSWCDHVLTSQILAACAPGTTLALEDLTNIRLRGRRFGRDMRRRLHAWSFRRQQEMLAYKAPERGVKVVFVDARYTSQTCSACGHVERKNRVSRDAFRCRQCGHEEHADLNAARNIAANWTTSQATGGPPVDVSLPHVAHAQDVPAPKTGRGSRTSGVTKGRSHGRSPKPLPLGRGCLLPHRLSLGVG